jgi:ATP-dependent DNA helicase Q1
LAEILELSREEYQSKSDVGPSGSVDEPSYLRKQNLNGELNKIEREISDVVQNIKELRDLHSDLLQQKSKIEKQLGEVQPTPNGMNGTTDRKGKGKAKQDSIDYTLEFDWSYELKARMKKVFGIDNFRLCQQGCVL